MNLLFTVLQVALGIISANPERAAGNLCGYFPQDTLVSDAPKGYKPFYISHIARHGSRFLDENSADCFLAADTLAFYAGQGLLTDEGIALMKDLRMLKNLSEGHYGALTELGAREHRQICDRMVRHYPEVFSNPRRNKAEAFSTSSPRVVASMSSFVGELAEIAPGVEVAVCQTKWGGEDPQSQEVNGYSDRVNEDLTELTKLKSSQLRRVRKKIARKYDNFDSFAARIFKDPGLVPASTPKYIAKTSFKAFKTGRVTDPETMPSMGKYLSAGELYYMWTSSCIGWLRYINMPGYVSPLAILRGGGILERIIHDADEAIDAKSPMAATFRFSHDTYLLPLMGAIPLEGAAMECEDKYLLEHFQDFNFICPACNVQLVFYKNRKGSVLVKFLLNEKETLIHGLAPKTGCFYEWDSVKEFWAHRGIRS